MYTLHHPSHIADLGTDKPNTKDLIEYIGSSDLLDSMVENDLISYADNISKNTSKGRESDKELS